MFLDSKLVGVDSLYIDATPDAQPLAADLECGAIVLSTWQVFDNAQDAAEPAYGSGNQANLVAGNNQTITEIYYGFGGNAVHPLKAGETSGYIYCNNANEIFVRTNANNPLKRVFFTIYQLRRNDTNK